MKHAGKRRHQGYIVWAQGDLRYAHTLWSTTQRRYKGKDVDQRTLIYDIISVFWSTLVALSSAPRNEAPPTSQCNAFPHN